MVEQIYNIILRAFKASVGFFDQLINAVPGAKTAVVWSVFVGLSLSLIIVPLRGFQVTDMQSAFADYGKQNVHNYKKAYHNAYGQGKYSNGSRVTNDLSYKGKFEKRPAGGTRRSPVSGMR